MPNRNPTLGSRPRSERDRQYNSTQRMEHDQRKTARWQRYAEWLIRRAPLCFNPMGVHGGEVAAKEVHHIFGAISYPLLFWETSNTVPLCTKCHRLIEAKERAGLATQALFGDWKRIAERIESER